MLSTLLFILFFILKIIGVLLLVLLFMMLLLLLVPIRYSFATKYMEEEAFQLCGSVNWFLFLVRAELKYADSKLNYRFRILWKTLFTSEKMQEDIDSDRSDRPKQDPEELKAPKKVPKKAPAKVPAKTDISNHASKESEIKATGVEKKNKKDNKKNHKSKKADEKKNHHSDSTSSHDDDADATTSVGITEKFSHLMDRMDGMKEKAEEYQLISLIEIAKETLLRIARHIWPRRIEGFMRFGFGDPSYTGRITAFLAMLYPSYGKTFSIEPDFQTTCFETDCAARGRIRIGFFVIIVISLLMKKEVRKLIGLLLK